MLSMFRRSESGAPPAQLLELRDGQVTYLCHLAQPTGKESRVRVSVAPGQVVELRVMVESVEVDDDYYLHTARVIGGPALDGAALGRAQRHALGLRVKSRHLPGFWGLTVDLSRTGMQLELTGTLQVGQLIEMSIDFDRFDLSALECVANVMWCRHHQSGRETRYRAGLKFIESDPQMTAKIHQMADFFEQRSQDDLENLLKQAMMLRQTTGPAPRQAPVQIVSARRTSFEIPLNAAVAGYHWELDSRHLILKLRTPEGSEGYLEFPECRTVRDYGCFQGARARGLVTSSDSELLRALHSGSLRHYQVLDPEGGVLLEIASLPICACG